MEKTGSIDHKDVLDCARMSAAAATVGTDHAKLLAYHHLMSCYVKSRGLMEDFETFQGEMLSEICNLEPLDFLL